MNCFGEPQVDIDSTETDVEDFDTLIDRVLQLVASLRAVQAFECRNRG